jgi:hypothetical protein
MKHELIILSETHPDYPAIVSAPPWRIIVCKDALQYIVQKRQGSQWHNRSYHHEWQSIALRHPDIGVASQSPLLLRRERHDANAEGRFTGHVCM